MERNDRLTSAQRLHLLNSSHVQRKLEQGPRLQPLFRARGDAKKAVTELYLTILSRFPTDDELKVAERYLQFYPTDDDLHMRLGYFRLWQGNYAPAVQAFEQAIQRGEATGDDASEAIFGIGYNQYFRQGRHEGAMEAFEVSRDLATSALKRSRASFWIDQPRSSRWRRSALARSCSRPAGSTRKASSTSSTGPRT